MGIAIGPLTEKISLKNHVVQKFSGAGVSLMVICIYISVLVQSHYNLVAIATVSAVGLAALISGLAGFAFGAICGAMLFQFRVDPVQTVQLMLLCSLANQLLCVWRLKSGIRLGALTPFVIGGAFGVPIGVWLLVHLKPHYYLVGLGILLSVYGIYMIFRPPFVAKLQHPLFDAVSGFLGGVMGGFAATPGAPVAIWCAAKGWNGMAQRAVVQPYIVIVQSIGLGAIALMHPGSPSYLIPSSLTLLCVPVGLLGTWWGFTFGKSLTDRQFARYLNILLIVSGFGCLV